MIKRFGGMNISSKNPRALARFYADALGVPILTENPDASDYDGVELGFSKTEPVIWIWNEEKWGKSNAGAVTFVFYCDDLAKMHAQIKARGFAVDPPARAVWGGMELTCRDPDGNHILMLEG
ncbi:MAG: VOC family protein [Christensenellales bacterium]|jgi:predicted enzyme related to lactoylglutathione lyase